MIERGRERERESDPWEEQTAAAVRGEWFCAVYSRLTREKFISGYSLVKHVDLVARRDKVAPPGIFQRAPRFEDSRLGMMASNLICAHARGTTALLI